MKLSYAVVFERTPNNYGAYAPDVPGCVSVGDTWPEMQAMIREALTFHIEAMVENGEAIPEPRMSLEEAIAYHCQVLAEYEKNPPTRIPRRAAHLVHNLRNSRDRSANTATGGPRLLTTHMSFRCLANNLVV